MVLPCSCSVLRACTLWIISPALAQEPTQTFCEALVIGLCADWVKGDPSLHRGLVGIWEHRHQAIVGFLSDSSREFSRNEVADSCWLWAIFSQVGCRDNLDQEARYLMMAKPCREGRGRIFLDGALLFGSRFSSWGSDFQFSLGAFCINCFSWLKINLNSDLSFILVLCSIFGSRHCFIAITKSYVLQFSCSD